MTKSIRIDHPGDGDWIMGRVDGTFDPFRDHTVARADDAGKILGGVAFTGYVGGAICMHMASTEQPNWASRDFLWMVYHYAFVQLGCRKVIGLVASNNSRALSIDLRMGFRVEAVVRDVYFDGADMLILTMQRADCRFLKMTPKHYRSNLDART